MPWNSQFPNINPGKQLNSKLMFSLYDQKRGNTLMHCMVCILLPFLAHFIVVDIARTRTLTGRNNFY